MEIIDKIVLPQSAHHLILLKYILILTFILFIPYASLLFGSLILSVFYKLKSQKAANSFYEKLSVDLIDLITFNKGIAVTLGVVPLLSAAFCYAQLLHLSNLLVVQYLLITTLLFIAALIFVYTYKHSLHLKRIFETADNKIGLEFKEELNNYKNIAEKTFHKSSYLGLIFLLISIYLFVSSVEFTQAPEKWNNNNNLFELLFSLDSFVSFILFLLFSFGFTSSFLIFKYSKLLVENNSKSYENFVVNLSLNIGLISTIILPVMVIISVLLKSKYALSYNVFGFTVLALAAILFLSILFYLMYKKREFKYNAATIYLFIFAVAFLIIKDQSAFSISSKKHFEELALNYEQYKKNLLEQTGLLKETVSGEDIFNSKCIACHQFDRKVVGPPYNEVLPKYEGKFQDLVNFILNPTKVNPDYPPMPNQGLKPKEAEAVANYIMNTYKK